MGEILSKVQVHVPFDLLKEKLLPRLIQEGIQPEIAISHLDLVRYSREDFQNIAKRLTGSGLSVTFHAPFMDLRPGAIDPEIRRVTLDRLLAVMALVPWFRPRTVVCHASFDEKYYVASGAMQWLENSIDTWQKVLAAIQGSETIIVLENVYERYPEPLRKLLDTLNSPQIRFCFDTGHANAFGDTPLSGWIADLGCHLREVHLHDNHGVKDEHLAMGEGNFPFETLMALLQRRNLKPIFTLEPHSEETLQRMLAHLQEMRLLDDQ